MIGMSIWLFRCEWLWAGLSALCLVLLCGREQQLAPGGANQQLGNPGHANGGLLYCPPWQFQGSTGCSCAAFSVVLCSTQSEFECAVTFSVAWCFFFSLVLISHLIPFLLPLFLQSIWSSSMMQPGPSALEQLLMQQKQKQQRGHGNMNPPHWEPTGRRTCVKHDSTEEVKHHKLQSEISGIICARRLETANDVKRQAQNEPLAWPTRDVQPSPLLSLSLTHSVSLPVPLWHRGRASTWPVTLLST